MLKRSKKFIAIFLLIAMLIGVATTATATTFDA